MNKFKELLQIMAFGIAGVLFGIGAIGIFLSVMYMLATTLIGNVIIGVFAVFMLGLGLRNDYRKSHGLD